MLMQLNISMVMFHPPLDIQSNSERFHGNISQPTILLQKHFFFHKADSSFYKLF